MGREHRPLKRTWVRGLTVNGKAVVQTAHERYHYSRSVSAGRPLKCRITGLKLRAVECDCYPPRNHGKHLRREAA